MKNNPIKPHCGHHVPHTPPVRLGEINYTSEQINALLGMIPFKADRAEVPKMEKLSDVNYVGHVVDPSLLVYQSQPSWALVGSLKRAKPYFYYVEGYVPKGYTAGWNDISPVLGTYDLTADKVSIFDFNLVTEYNVSRNHPNVKRDFSNDWGMAKFYYPEYDEYKPCKVYNEGDRVNMPDYTGNTFIALRETSQPPFITLSVSSEFTLNEAIEITPKQYRYPGIRLTFVNSGTHQAETWFWLGGEWKNEDEWIKPSDGVTINNLPDEEDISATNDAIPRLQLKDKEYNKYSFSGLGRVYLRKNIVNGVNVLTQDMILNENTRYIIQYDYDLNGRTITVPSGCILDFQGGSISNGFVNLNSCKIESSTKCFKDIVFVGDKWLHDFNLKWIGTSSNGDSYGVLKDMVSIFNGVITKVYFDENIKSEGGKIILPLNFHIDGRGNTISFTSTNDEYCLMLGNLCSLKDLTLSISDTYTGCVLLVDTQSRPLDRACNQFALNNVVISAPWNDTNVYYHTGVKIKCTNESVNDGWNYLTGCYIDGLRINNCNIGIDYETINYNDDASKNFAWSNSFNFTRLYIRGNLGLILNFYDNGVNNPEDGASGLHNFSYYEFQALTKNSLAFVTNAMPTFSTLNVWDCTINGVMNIGAKVYIGSMLAGNKGSYSNTYYEDESGRYRIINGFKCYSSHLVFGSWHNDGFRFKLLMPDSSTPYTIYGKTKDRVVSTFTGNNIYSKQSIANQDSSFVVDSVYCERENIPVKLDFHSYNEYESYLYKPDGFGRIINRNLARIPITDDFICTILPNNNVLYIVRIKNEDGSSFVSNSIYEVSFKFLIPYKGKYGTDAESFKTYGQILNIDYSYGDDNYFYIRNYHDTLFGDNIETLSIIDKTKTTGLITLRFKVREEISYVNFMQIIQISSDVLIENVNDDTIQRNKRFDNYATKISDLSIRRLGQFVGASSERPSNMEEGFIYFDTTLNKPIWQKADGTWVDAAGQTV